MREGKRKNYLKKRFIYSSSIFLNEHGFLSTLAPPPKALQFPILKKKPDSPSKKPSIPLKKKLFPLQKINLHLPLQKPPFFPIIAMEKKWIPPKNKTISPPIKPPSRLPSPPPPHAAHFFPLKKTFFPFSWRSFLPSPPKKPPPPHREKIVTGIFRSGGCRHRLIFAPNSARN